MPLIVDENKALSEISTFKIGGPARYFTQISTLVELQEAILFAKKNGVAYHIVGKGSNSLFDDKGFDGLVILSKISFIEIKDNHVRVGSGYSFSLLGIQTARKGLGGLEFASGIPGSVGGAVFMNAGANGSETADTLSRVDFVHSDGKLESFNRIDLEFGYRSSSFHKMKGAISSAEFTLVSDPKAKERQRELLDYRMGTQPYSKPSCGCAFRNPTGQSAGKLIDQCGLKGHIEGGAMVSSLHANFIVNEEGASCKDVLHLLEVIREQVKQKTGYTLENEVRYVPFEGVHK